MTKISKNFICHDGQRVGVRYYLGPWIAGVDPSTIKIRPRKSRFPASFESAFKIENNSDMTTDYFEADCIRILPGHPLYDAVKQASQG